MPEKREDVEATLQQDTAPDTSQQKRKWRSIDWIAGGTFIAEVLWGSWWLVTQVCRIIPWNPHVSTEHFAQFYCGVGLGILSVGYLTLILLPIIFNIFKQGKDPKQDNDPRWFHARILSSGIVGGSYAFLLPVVMSLPEGGVNSGGAAALRQAILLATGGLIALIALGETRRKNDNDLKAANELQIRHEETLDQQKKQFNEQLEEQQKQFNASAFKERKAERRERYTKAVEQLGDEKAPIRMGGVYTLVGLVDEWLDEENLEYSERLKEGQVIINNLCAYIRSPFTLASRYYELSQDTPTTEVIYKNDQQKSHKKWQIISNNLYACIRSRFTPDSRHDELSQDSYTAFYKDREQEFYADKARLKSEADVRLGIIKEIHDRLQGSEKNTPGTWSDFEYDFSGSIFFYPIDLSYSYYLKSVIFSGSTYHNRANFHGSTYSRKADFSDSTYFWVSGSTDQDPPFYSYLGEADFSSSTYLGEADFSGSTYSGKADFRFSTYHIRADFSGSIYKSWTDFRISIYYVWTDFSDSTYESWTGFSGSVFCSYLYFSRTRSIRNNSNPSRFTTCSPQFCDEYVGNSFFSSDLHDNDFTVENGRGYPIYRNLEGLPLDCKFLDSEQEYYFAGEFRKMKNINNKLLNTKDPKKKVEFSKNLRDLNKELHKRHSEIRN